VKPAHRSVSMLDPADGSPILAHVARLTRRAFALGGTLGLVAVPLACALPPPPTPTRPALTRPPTREPTAKLIPYVSGGLGLFRDEWEARYGPPVSSTASFVLYRGGIGASFANGMVWYVEREWNFADAVGQDLARAESRRFLPGDAGAMSEHETRFLRRYDRYFSAALAARFASVASSDNAVDLWLGQPAGWFIVFYRDVGERVWSLALSTGNNPDLNERSRL